MPPEDDVLLAEEQPLPAAVSPTADSPGYIIESDPEEDPKEDDEDLEEDPTDYPTDRDDEEEEDSFRDDADDEEEDEDEDKDEEEEEHLASSDSVPPPACRTTARMSIRDQTPIPFSYAAEVDRFLAISTPPPSPLTSYSSLLPHITSPPLPVSSPLHMSPPPLPTSPTHPLGYRAKTPLSGTPPLLPIPLPTSSPPFLLLSIDCKAGVPEVTFPPWKKLCIALGPRYEVGESSSDPTARPTGGFRADYGFVGSLDAKIRRDPEREIDTRVHACTARLMEGEAKASREDWVQSMDASDTARFKVRGLRTMVLAQQTEIRYLRAADRRRQTQPTEVLTLLRTLQTQMAALQSPQTPARDPTHPDLPEEASSNS
ncbi:hypothetical protein Tco_0863311 [Tanacetum coccineum]